VLLADEAPESRPAPQSLPLPPDYLRGRYRHAQLFRVAPNDARQLETGALIYADADETDPLRAIGVVVRVTGKETIALVAGAIGQTASLREPDRTVAITLLARYPAD
jgi:sarcosine oxidase subunit alpha